MDFQRTRITVILQPSLPSIAPPSTTIQIASVWPYDGLLNNCECTKAMAHLHFHIPQHNRPSLTNHLNHLLIVLSFLFRFHSTGHLLIFRYYALLSILFTNHFMWECRFGLTQVSGRRRKENRSPRIAECSVDRPEYTENQMPEMQWTVSKVQDSNGTIYWLTDSN